MTGPVNPHLTTLLSARNMAHLATLMADGSPKVEPVWAVADGDRILVTTDAKSIKAVNIAADPRVALSIVSADDPYDQVLVRGVVAETRDDAEMVTLDAMSQQYLGTPYPRRRWFRRVVFVIEPRTVRSSRSGHAPAPSKEGKTDG